MKGAEMLSQERKPRFELYRDKSQTKEFRWRLIARNGEIVSSGEGYTTKKECEEGIEVVRNDSQVAPVIELDSE
jgi:uncharacterized protein YegP (UPF0339 family)